MSADPDELLTLGEAGKILGVTAMTIHRMTSDGLLERADPRPLKNRQITRSSVDRAATDWSRRITKGAAAAMLGVGADKVAQLLRAGVLTHHRYSPNPIAIDEVQHLITTGALTDPVHRGRGEHIWPPPKEDHVVAVGCERFRRSEADAGSSAADHHGACHW